jgi:anthranilate/para-aminobenzoate synthase component I
VGTSTVRLHRPGLPVQQLRMSIFDYLKRHLHGRAAEPDPALPFEFQLGFVGYLGYEMKAETGGRAEHPSPYPDAAFVFADRAVMIDHTPGGVTHCAGAPFPVEFDDASVISASPERFLRITPDRIAESKPIKGTRPRGARPTRTTRFDAAYSPAKKSVPRN